MKNLNSHLLHGKTLDLLAAQHEALVKAEARVAELERKQETRDGKWLDKWGCCKVCDGEIPAGHREDCDIYKLESEVRELERRVKANESDDEQEDRENQHFDTRP